jgi:autotransporter-associated beta strand protein
VHVAEGATLNGGTIFVGNGGTTNTVAELLIVDTDGGTTVDETVDINPGSQGNRTVGGNNTSGVNTYSGTISRDSDADDEAVTLTAASGGTVDFTGAFGGDDDVTISGGGITRFSTTAKTYTGDTIINGSSTLRLNAANLVDNGSAVTIASGSTFDLNNNSEEVGSIAGAGNITMGTGQLIAGGDNSSTTLSGVMSGSDPGSFVKKGTGTLTLSGINTYDGQTYTVGGTLQINTNQAASFSHTINVGETSGGDSATVAIGANAVTVTNAILIRAGSSGTKTLSASAASGTGTFSGRVDMNTDLAATATSGSTLSLGGVNLKNSGDNDLTTTGDVTLSGLIDVNNDASEVRHTGSGTLTISGDNSGEDYMLRPAGGTVILDNASALGNGYSDKIRFDGSATLRVSTTTGPASLGVKYEGNHTATIEVDGGVTFTIPGVVDD